jgi:Ribosomal protein S15P/S13E
MARMHTKKKGKSKSRKPMLDGSTEIKSQLGKEEAEKLILQYSRQGMGPTAIGERLKRENGVPYPKSTLGRRITELLKEEKASTPIPEDLMNLMAKAINLNKHIEKNRQDKSNTLNMERVKAKIWRLTKYYIRKGILPSNWRYDPKQAELLIRGRS